MQVTSRLWRGRLLAPHASDLTAFPSWCFDRGSWSLSHWTPPQKRVSNSNVNTIGDAAAEASRPFVWFASQFVPNQQVHFQSLRLSLSLEAANLDCSPPLPWQISRFRTLGSSQPPCFASTSALKVLEGAFQSQHYCAIWMNMVIVTTVYLSSRVCLNIHVFVSTLSGHLTAYNKWENVFFKKKKQF